MGGKAALAARSSACLSWPSLNNILNLLNIFPVRAADCQGGGPRGADAGAGARTDAWGRALRLGDKVMQRRNNYDKGVFNGDIGRITAAAPGGIITASFDGEEIRYDETEAAQLSLAYALSVHKPRAPSIQRWSSPFLGEHAAMLQRNLLYTAVTRARRLVVIVGSRAALQARSGGRSRQVDARGSPSGCAGRCDPVGRASLSWRNVTAKMSRRVPSCLGVGSGAADWMPHEAHTGT